MALFKHFKGDKTIWAMIFFLALYSFLPVYSAGANLVFTVGSAGSTLGILIKHFVHVVIGFSLLFVVHKIPYDKFKIYSIIGIPIVIVFLFLSFISGQTIGGANASRWLVIPFVNLSFQPSTVAFYVLMTYLAFVLTKNFNEEFTFKKSLLYIWLPVGAVLVLIFPSNFSTAALIFSIVLITAFVGGYKLKYIFNILGFALVSVLLFFLLAKAYPGAPLLSRVSTWEKRIERFVTDKKGEDNYQIENSKIAISKGEIFGVGAGRSTQKYFLPQSSSDFIFAIIVEEYGLFGGLTLIVIYLILFSRFLIRANNAPTLFGKLLIVGLGFPIIFQAFINMGVAVELLPVTGQPLPLISSGGTSMWMTFIALGIVLSVTKTAEEVKEHEKEAQLREQALQNIIDKEVTQLIKTETNQDEATEEEQVNDKIKKMKATIREVMQDGEGDSLCKGKNPMDSIIDKD